MARDIDPNNLSIGDVLRIVAPTIALIAILILVGRFAPNYVWLLLVLISVGAFVCVLRLPKKDLAAIAEHEQQLEDKIGSFPIVGSIAKIAWRLLGWLSIVFGVFVLVLLAATSVRNIF